jgi:hypothetical protein
MTIGNVARSSVVFAIAIGLLGAPVAQACTPEAYMSPGAVAKASGETGPKSPQGQSTGTPWSTSSAAIPRTAPDAESSGLPGPAAIWVLGASLLAGVLVAIVVYGHGASGRGRKSDAGPSPGEPPDEVEAELQELIAEARAAQSLECAAPHAGRPRSS